MVGYPSFLVGNKDYAGGVGFFCQNILPHKIHGKYRPPMKLKVIKTIDYVLGRYEIIQDLKFKMAI